MRANSYLTLTTALDRFDMGDTTEKVTAALNTSQCRWLLVSFSSDWLFPPFQSQQLVDSLLASGKAVTYCNVQSDCGHDAFLLPNDLATYGELIRAFLDDLDTSREPESKQSDNPDTVQSLAYSKPDAPTSIFRHRIDYDTILDLIPAGAGVLDIGCGAGGLLARLRNRGHKRLLGIEIDERAIVVCARRGIDVVHADANQGLRAFSEKQFDYVVLSQTLQAVDDVEQVLDDMLRIGRLAVVSFPNVAYREFRFQLAAEGRAPRLHHRDGLSWHDTPHVRCLSIADFEDFCKEHSIHIEKQIALETGSGRRIDVNPNLNADLGIFVLKQY